MPKRTFSSLRYGTQTFVFRREEERTAMIALAIHLGYGEKNLNEFRGKITPFSLGTEFPNQILTAVLRKVPGLSPGVWEVSISLASAETAGIVKFKEALIRAIETLDGE
jgi:hypothetical protein